LNDWFAESQLFVDGYSFGDLLHEPAPFSHHPCSLIKIICIPD